MTKEQIVEAINTFDKHAPAGQYLIFECRPSCKRDFWSTTECPHGSTKFLTARSKTIYGTIVIRNATDVIVRWMNS